MTRIVCFIISFLLLSSSLIAVFALSACAQLHPQLAQNAPAKRQEPAPEYIPKEPIGIKCGELLLSYPRGENNNKIDAASTFLVGTIPAGRKLSCNGQEINANADGYFAHVVKLNYGKNEFSLILSGQESNPLNVSVYRPTPPPALASTTFNILPESIQPKEALGVAPGDIVQFAARATPGCQMSVQIGGRLIPLKSALVHKGKSTSVNLGLDTAFGVSFQRSPAAVKDLYLGFYKIQTGDNFQKAVPLFRLQKGKKEIKARAKGSVSVVQQPQILLTAHSKTIVRLGPGASRTTPLPQSVRMLADGYKGDWWRIDLCPGRHVWIAREDMIQEEDSHAIPESKVDTVNPASDSYGARIAIPLNQRLPYQIEQDLHNKRLYLRIFGATANTDFVTSDPATGNSAYAKLIDHISWKQKSDLQYELCCQLKKNEQWGFWADYEDNTLVLHVKSAPAIDLASAHGSLKGTIICVDPGHGGKEPGSIGCSGAKEAGINFAIADKLKNQLEELGARVIMTRNGDNFVSLDDRVEIAIAAKADLLVSVHNNSLPDGRDPIAEHGTSSYYYHPQSIEIAKIAQKQLAQTTGLKDFGCRYQNLALCRPSQMPAILMEIGFMINPDEFSKLVNPQFQEQTAHSIAVSIKKYFYDKIKSETNDEN